MPGLDLLLWFFPQTKHGLPGFAYPEEGRSSAFFVITLLQSQHVFVERNGSLQVLHEQMGFIKSFDHALIRGSVCHLVAPRFCWKAVKVGAPWFPGQFKAPRTICFSRAPLTE